MGLLQRGKRELQFLRLVVKIANLNFFPPGSIALARRAKASTFFILIENNNPAIAPLWLSEQSPTYHFLDTVAAMLLSAGVLHP